MAVGDEQTIDNSEKSKSDDKLRDKHTRWLSPFASNRGCEATINHIAVPGHVVAPGS